MLAPYDIVIINSEYADPEVAGKRGHVIGMVEGDDIGVFVYDVQRVWCLKTTDVTPVGERDVVAERERGSPLRVSAKGELLD